MKQQKQKVRPVRVGLFNSNKGITYFLIHVGLKRYNTERYLSYLYKIAELSTDN